MANARYVVPGPCSVEYNGLDLGFTKSGILIRVETQMIPITDDEHGTEPADYIRAGKSATVEAAFLDADKIRLAAPFIGSLFSNLGLADGGTNWVGRLANDGTGTNPYVDSDPATNIGRELIITERDNSNQWIADFALMSDPQQILMASTQELIVPVVFVIALNDDDELFSTVPGYIS